MYYDFILCGLRVHFEVPWELTITDGTLQFLVDSEGDSENRDLICRFHEREQLSLPENAGVWSIDNYFVSSRDKCKIYHCSSRVKPPYCCMEWDYNNPHILNCFYVKGAEHQIEFTKNLITLLGLETFLLNFGGLILHSSIVAWQGKGILFSAPSGTGKSTQADLWEKYMGSQTLNGDRAGIRCVDGIWRAYGLPYAGTSGIYRNESVPIEAIVLLKQAPENKICRVTPLEAFKKLLPECNARRWDPDFMDRLIGILSAVIQAVPVYQLECRPDEEAVQLLHDTIVKDR